MRLVPSSLHDGIRHIVREALREGVFDTGDDVEKEKLNRSRALYKNYTIDFVEGKTWLYDGNRPSSP